MANEYWLTDEQRRAIERLIPTGRRGGRPGRNREVISGIVHVLKFGCRWWDCPEVYGPHTTIFNRFNRWSKAGIWQGMLQRLITDMPRICSVSTAPQPRRTAVMLAEKGSRRSGDRS